MPNIVKNYLDLEDLEGIIDAAKYTSTVATMKATDYDLGDNVKTEGRTTANDGGGATYRIVAGGTGIDDGGSYHDLSNGNQAELIIEGAVIVDQWGAIGDGTSDSLTSIQNAINFATNNDIQLKFLSGTYVVSDALDIVGSISLSGQGKYTTEIKKLNTSINDGILVKSDSDAIYDFLSITDISLTGALFESDFVETSGGVISARNIVAVNITDVNISNSRGFGINLNICGSAKVTGCRVQYVYRDAIAVWNTSELLIHNNIVKGNDDDGISVSRSTFTTFEDKEKRNIIITSNVLIDSGGVRTQGCNKAIIANNTFERVKAAEGAIFISTFPFGNTNYATANYFDVHNNIITDRLDRNLSTGDPLTRNFRAVIKIEGVPGIAGTLAAPPREVDSSDGSIVTPYDYYYDTSGSLNNQPIGKVDGIYVRDNIVKRTLPAVTNYSDWGFGQMFSRFSGTGFTNPQVTDTALAMVPFEMEGPVNKLYVERNLLAGSGDFGIFFKALAESGVVSDGDLQNVFIKNNDIYDNLGAGISLDVYGTTTQNVEISNNNIDNDPFFRSSSRQNTGSAFTGAWVSQTGSVGVNSSNVDNTVITGNAFRNCSIPYLQGGSLSITRLDNKIYAQPVDSGYSLSNLGVGSIPADAQYEAKVIYEDSNPTSATYRDVLEPTTYQTSGSTAPTQGFYMEGVFVTSRALNPVLKNGQTQAIHGFKRLTTGTGHVDGTDWQAVWFEI